MLDLKYHPELIEQAVWSAARCDAVVENELHRALDPIYELPSSEKRELDFRETFVAWFTRLQLSQFLDETLAHFARIVDQVEEGVVRAAPRRKSEGAELFVRHDADTIRRTLVVQVCPETLGDWEIARDKLLRELQHVEDMLDVDFAYEPESIDGLPSQQQIVRDRYGILWNICVEARLSRSGLLSSVQESRLCNQFERAFTMAGRPPMAEAFASLWNQPNVSHVQLLNWAKNPREWHLPGNGAASSDSLGAPCPTCRFPTFDWFERTDCWTDTLVSAVRQSSPEWTPENGICRQCAETFLSNPTVQTP